MDLSNRLIRHEKTRKRGNSMTKVNRYNGQQRRTQNLAQRRKQYKPLEVGQTLTQPTADPKLKETTGTIDFSQPKPVVTNPQVQPSADDIALLNQQNTLAEQNRKIEKIKKQIETEEKKLAQMNRDDNPGKYDAQAERIKDKKAKLTKLYDDRAGIETKIEKTKNNILKANEPAPAGDPLAVKKSQTTPQKETILGDSKNQSVAEAPKAEAPKAEAPKTEAPKAEAPKTEAPKVETPKNEAPVTETPVEAPKTKKPYEAPTTKVKSKGGFFSKIGNFFKGKKLGKGGKIAIGVAAVATVAAGAYAIFGGSDDKKETNVQPETAQKAEQQKTPAPADTATVAPDSTATPKDTVATNLDQALALADEAKAKEKEKEIEKAEKKEEAKKAEAKKAEAKKAEDKKAEESKKEEQAKETAKADTTATKKVKPAAANVEKQDTVKNDTTKVAGQANANIAVPEDKSKVAPQAQANKSQEVNNREKAQPAQGAQATKQTDKQVAQETKEWIAKNGENYWNYAKRELIFEHQGQAGYRPSNKEIADRMLEVMKRNGVDFAADGIHSNPMLKIGDKVKVLFEEKAA